MLKHAFTESAVGPQFLHDILYLRMHLAVFDCIAICLFNSGLDWTRRLSLRHQAVAHLASIAVLFEKGCEFLSKKQFPGTGYSGKGKSSYCTIN